MIENIFYHEHYIHVGFECSEITQVLDKLAGVDKSADYNEAIADAINSVIEMYRAQKGVESQIF